MSKAKGYSIWLMPEGKHYRLLNNTIYEFSKKYSTPSFLPHVTLLGDVEGNESDISNKTTLLAQNLKEFYVTLQSGNYGDTYFKSLFLTALKEQDILKANQQARTRFGREKDSTFIARFLPPEEIFVESPLIPVIIQSPTRT
ncbi:MAG: hypothetical protein AABX12_02545 [Nanoarchaeota archaeon]